MQILPEEGREVDERRAYGAVSRIIPVSDKPETNQLLAPIQVAVAAPHLCIRERRCGWVGGCDCVRAGAHVCIYACHRLVSNKS